MNSWQLLRALRRQWLVTLTGCLIVLGCCYHVTQLRGLYQQQVDVIFLAPDQPDTNTFQNATGSLIGTAGIISQVVAGSASGAAPVSENATLVGTGVEHGYSVRLPNEGGQWAINYTRPVLDVQVVGTSAEEVSTRMTAVVARINAELQARQDAFGVKPQYRITTRLNPALGYVSHSTGSPPRTLAATLLLGLGLTAAAAVVVDGFRHRLRARPRPKHGSGPGRLGPTSAWADPGVDGLDEIRRPQAIGGGTAGQ